MIVSIIIPTRNRAEILKKTLYALVKQLTEEDEVLVVDNGSSDNTKEVIFEFQGKFSIKYFFEPRKGPSFARNLGVKKAKGEIIAFLDDDCFVLKNWLSEIKSLSYRSAEDIIYQGKIIHVFSKRTLLSELFVLRQEEDWQRIKNRLSFRSGRYLNFLNSGNFFLKKTVLEKLDYVFDSKLFPFIGEERDLAIRLQLIGCKIIHAPKTAVRHIQQRTSILAMPKVVFDYGRAEGILETKYIVKPKTKALFKKEISLFSKNPFFIKEIFGRANHFLKKGLMVYLGVMTYLFVKETVYALGRLYGRVIAAFQRKRR